MNCTKFFVQSGNGSYLKISYFGLFRGVRFVKRKHNATLFEKNIAEHAAAIYGGSVVPAMRRYVVCGADPNDPAMTIDWDEDMKVGILWKAKDRDRLFLVAKDDDSAATMIKMFKTYFFPAEGEELVICNIREVKDDAGKP